MFTWAQLRGALGIGLIWALGGVALGGVIELLDNLLPGGFARQVDMWPQTLALVAFPRGVLFGVLISRFAAGRQLRDLGYRQFIGWASVAGAVVSGIGVFSGFDPGAFLVPIGLSAAAGAATLAAARVATRRAALNDPPDEPRLTA